MKPIALVTGANGWLGTQFVQSLRNGITDDDRFGPDPERAIRCLVLPDTDTSLLRETPNIEVFEGDLTDRSTLAAFTEGATGAVVFHTAGLVHPTGRVAEFYRVNADGTKNVLDVARKAGAKRFIHISSNSPFGTNRATDPPFPTSAAFNPYMHYGKSKMQAEEAVTAARQAGDIETVILRPPWFYGRNQPPRQTQFFRMIRDGGMPQIGDGTNRRSMAYTENIAQAMLLAEEVDAADGRSYWIADREPYEMRQIVATVRCVLEELGFETRDTRLKLPGFVSDIAEMADALIQGVGLYQQKIHVLGELNKHIACSISAAVEELGYDPKVDLELGMRRSIEWLMERGMLTP